MRRVWVAGFLLLAQGASAQPSEEGQDLYQENCASCHGRHLNDGTFAPPLKGARFRKDWGGKNAADLLAFMQDNMPPSAAGTLSDAEYLAVLSVVLDANGVKMTSNDPKAADFKAMLLPPP